MIIGQGIIFILSIYVITFYVGLDFDFACDITNSRDRITGKELHVFFPIYETPELAFQISSLTCDFSLRMFIPLGTVHFLWGRGGWWDLVDSLWRI